MTCGINRPTRPRTRPRSHALVLALVLGARAVLAQTTGTAPPSPDAARLQERIADLERENAQLRARIDALRGQLARQRGAEPVPMITADVPRDPLAAPASLLAELQRRYEREFGEFPRQTPSQIENLKRHAERWAAAVNHDVHGRTRWLVQFGEIIETTPGVFEAAARVIDDATFAPIGDPVRLDIPSRFVDRVRSMDRVRARENEQAGGKKPWAWELHLTLSADVKFRPDTPDVGLFNAVTLVGSYVEFGMKLEWQGLTDRTLPPPVEAHFDPSRNPFQPNTGEAR